MLRSLLFLKIFQRRFRSLSEIVLIRVKILAIFPQKLHLKMFTKTRNLSSETICEKYWLKLAILLTSCCWETRDLSSDIIQESFQDKLRSPFKCFPGNCQKVMSIFSPGYSWSFLRNTCSLSSEDALEKSRFFNKSYPEKFPLKLSRYL